MAILHAVPLGSAVTYFQAIVLGFRPESLELASEGLPARVEVVEEFGADAYVFCVAEVLGLGSRRGFSNSFCFRLLETRIKSLP